MHDRKLKNKKKTNLSLKKNKIYFFTKNLKTRRLTKKFNYVKIDSFLITKIFLLKIFRVQLLPNIQIKLIFDLLFLSIINLKILLATVFKYKNKKKIEFKIDKIVAEEFRKYFVSWKDYLKNKNIWKLKCNLTNCKKLLKKFKKNTKTYLGEFSGTKIKK